VTDLLAARTQMAVSLGFHIVFAVVGMAMPLFMIIAEWRYIRTGDSMYLDLAKRWAKGTAILFAVGAVSGTVLSFELGLLWPAFMERAGPLIGMPFSLEGFAFFLEAIFLGVYLYGWDRVSRTAHVFAGAVVSLSGLASGVFVVAVNAWMNTPVGFTLRDGALANIDVVRAFFSPAFPAQALHMALAAYSSVAFAVLAIHSARLLRTPDSPFHRRAAGIALLVATVVTPLQIASGDVAAKAIAKYQPQKLAAAEAHFETMAGAPISLGGFPDAEQGTLHGAVQVPKVLSFLATGDPNGVVRGLSDFPRDEWPPLAIVHWSFDVMVACGFAMLALVAFAVLQRAKKRNPFDNRLFLRLAVLCGPLGIVAIEAGWVVTEVGRQPWIVVGVLRTADAVTPMPGLLVPCAAITALYLVLSVVVASLLRAHVLSAPSGAAGTLSEADVTP
jgi:cytochrome bd ubiquinol oxidase subunit I